MAAGLGMIAESMLTADVVVFYKGLMQYTIPLNFGQEVELPKWNKPPIMTNREERYLSVLNKLADHLERGQFAQVRMTLGGLKTYWGSRADSGGIPCCPELMIIYGQISQTVDRLLKSGQLEKKRLLLFMDNTLKIYIAGLVREITYSYQHSDVGRMQLASLLMDLTETAEEVLGPIIY